MTSDLEQLREPPAFRRDRLAHVWIVMRGIADAGAVLLGNRQLRTLSLRSAADDR